MIASLLSATLSRPSGSFSFLGSHCPSLSTWREEHGPPALKRVGVAQQVFCKVKMAMLFQTIMQWAHVSFPQMNMTAIMLTLALQ
jgi:hypothetical protein